MAYVRGGPQSARPAGSPDPGAARTPDARSGTHIGGVGRLHRPIPPDLSESGEFDWDRVGIFGAGIALGALLGVAITLFTAPVSGPDARLAVRRKARRALWTGKDAWEDLRDEFATATMRKKKDLRRRRRRVREVWSDGSLE